jgi:xanthine dehydrogenase accessory factor
VKRALLERIIEARDAKRSSVLVRGLKNKLKFLVDENQIVGDVPNTLSGLLEHATNALDKDGTQTVDFSGETYLIQTLGGSRRLLVIGAVHIAQKLIPMAMIAGYEVQLIDPRKAFASSERFPGINIVNDWPHEVMKTLQLDSRTAVVTLSHDAKIDEPALQAALESRAFYIGALGSQKNHTKRIQRLAALGFDQKTLARIAGPIGLPLGGRSPAEIAVAILAQIIQAVYQQKR